MREVREQEERGEEPGGEGRRGWVKNKEQERREGRGEKGTEEEGRGGR